MHEIIKIVASYFIVIPVLLVLYVFYKLPAKQRGRFTLLAVGSALLSLLLAQLGSHLLNDPRPFVVGHFTPLIAHANDNGFPSDHTLLASFVGFVLLGYTKKLGLVTLLLAALIGAARMAAGIHHLEDIVGSFVITGLSVLVIKKVLEAFYPIEASQPSQHD